jgi:hypothetical protein
MGPGVFGSEIAKGFTKVKGAPRLVIIGNAGPYHDGTVLILCVVGFRKEVAIAPVNTLALRSKLF